MNIVAAEHFWGVVLLAQLFNLRKYFSDGFLFAAYHLPGTILHELSHWLVALVLWGKPDRISIIPTEQHLGCVRSRNSTWFNTLPICLAPLGLVPLANYIYQGWFQWFPKDLPHQLFLYVTLFICLSGSMPSVTDWKLAFNSKFGVLIWVSITCCLLYFKPWAGL